MGRRSKFDNEEAVEFALDQYRLHGYEACSVKALSEKLGITRSSFYHAFGTREALFERALKKYCERWPDSELSDTLPASEVLSLITAATHEVCFRKDEKGRSTGCLVVNTVASVDCSSDNPVGEMVSKVVVERTELIARMLGKAQLAGAIERDRDVGEMAVGVHALMFGINVMVRAGCSAETLWAGARTTLEALGLLDESSIKASLN